MLKKLQLTNFKSHADSKLDCSNLTLLLGTNSSGKSAVIQSILLMVQNITDKKNDVLNGKLVTLGNFKEVVNFVINPNCFGLKLTSDTNEIMELLYFLTNDHKDTEVFFNYSDKEFEAKLNRTNQRIHILLSNEMYVQKSVELIIDYFEKNKFSSISAELIANKFSNSLELQVNYWLSKIISYELETFYDCEIFKAIGRFRLSFSKQSVKYVMPINAGSGVTILMKIIVICLSSKKGDLIIIQNPEIHLHPKVQSLLVDFFIFIANSGRQLLIETHSDHIFNGIKVGINQNKIGTQDVAVHFFTLGNDYITKHDKIEINELGQVKNAVPGLFDQFTNDLKTLVGF